MPKINDVKNPEQKTATSNDRAKIKRLQQTAKASTKVRTTFFLKPEHYQKLRAVAYWDRKSMATIVTQVLEKFFSTRQIDPIPEDKQGIEEIFPND